MNLDDSLGKAPKLTVKGGSQKGVPRALPGQQSVHHKMVVDPAKFDVKPPERRSIKGLEDLGGIGDEGENVDAPFKLSLEGCGLHMSGALVTKEEEGDAGVAYGPLVRHQIHNPAKTLSAQAPCLCPAHVGRPAAASDPGGPLKTESDLQVPLLIKCSLQDVNAQEDTPIGSCKRQQRRNSTPTNR